MAKVQDIKLTDGDLLFDDGDFKLHDSDQQHIEHIMVAYKGCYRYSPLTGVGISAYLNSPKTAATIQKLRQKVKLQLEFDGYTNIELAGDILDKSIISAKRP